MQNETRAGMPLPPYSHTAGEVQKVECNGQLTREPRRRRRKGGPQRELTPLSWHQIARLSTAAWGRAEDRTVRAALLHAPTGHAEKGPDYNWPQSIAPRLPVLHTVRHASLSGLSCAPRAKEIVIIATLNSHLIYIIHILIPKVTRLTMTGPRCPRRGTGRIRSADDPHLPTDCCSIPITKNSVR